MKIALFGATGHAGRFILDEAIKAGHEITVLLRHPEKLKLQNDQVTVQVGDALKPEDVSEVVRGKDAIISAISEGPDIQYHTQRIATENIIRAMEVHGVSRMLCMGAIGILQHDEHSLIRDQAFYDQTYVPISLEHSAVNNLLSQSDLLWTQVCPPTIVAAPPDGAYLVKINYPPSKNPEAYAGNIGLFMMEELRNNAFIRQRVGITNA
jgi:uncharacterized protein